VTSKPRVLVAEDSATNRKLIARMLEAYGYAVRLVTTGIAAVEARAEPNGCEADIILMDIEMPGMNGEDACRLIRAHEAAHPQMSRIPIIALTANSSPDQIARYLGAGMDAHIAKPIDWPSLVAAIDALVPGPR
jgi:CheY-like chemotaxis protein